MDIYLFNKVYSVEIPINYVPVANDGGYTKDDDIFIIPFKDIFCTQMVKQGGDPVEDYLMLFRKI